MTRSTRAPRASKRPSRRRHSRRPAAFALAALVTATAAGCAGSAAAGRAGNGSPGMVLINTSQYDGNIITPVAKPSGTLTADDGRSFNVRTDTRGIVTLLYFGYTHCPDLCPLTMSNTSAAVRMLPRADQARIRVLFVSVDPGRDTLARLRGWLGGFDPAFVGLRGTLPEVEALEQQTGLPLGPLYRDSAGYVQLDHATEMFAYSTNNVAHEAFFPSTPPAEMAHDLKLRVAGGVPS